MSHLQSWSGTEPLPLGRPLLLEASAGTGKTWQIAHLVCRLVAEEDLRIDRILVITFTNAAATELRDRVRARLQQARAALEGDERPADEHLARLWEAPALRTERRRRVARALSEFDRAPISTIHGFSQRMLSELAFESGQEEGLELLADPSGITEELVADELALVYSVASEEELAILEDMGWSPSALRQVAALVCGPVAPRIEPAHADPAAEPQAPLAAVARWRALLQRAGEWWNGPAGEAARQGLLAGFEPRQAPGTTLKKDQYKPLNGAKLKKASVEKACLALGAWLAGTGLRSQRPAKGAEALAQLTLDKLEAAWSGKETEDERRAIRGLAEWVTALLVAQDELWPSALASFARRARAAVEQELQRKGVLTYDTMLSRLAEALAEGGAEGPLASAIRTRFDVALVDEFQDTDSAQWPVLQTVFAHPSRRLLLIGDPKQAIYSFRNADLHVYLAAAAGAERFTMGRNYRSDAGYVAAMNHFWQEGAQSFDLPEVDYVAVGAQQAACRVAGLPAVGERPRRPLELRWTDAEALGRGGVAIGSKDEGERLIAQLCAQEAHRLLASGATLQRDPAAPPVPLAPGHLAVLVRTNRQGVMVRDQLSALGIPAVSTSRSGVFASPPVAWLAAWLDAVADPGRDGPARALVTTPLFGWTLQDLALALQHASDEARGLSPLAPPPAAAGDEDAPPLRWGAWLETLGHWAQRWPTQGFLRVFDAALDQYGVLKRLLETPGGERHATDLRHLCELAHAYERAHRVSAAGLATWLRTLAAEAAGGDEGEESNQRLESDEDAVQIVTVHSAKGLEYPVVLLPFAWATRAPADKGQPLLRHDPRLGVVLDLRVAGSPGRAEAVAALAAENAQEDARLLYVALTRSAQACVAWLGPIGRAAAALDSSTLGRLALRPRSADGRVLRATSDLVIKAPTAKDPDGPSPEDARTLAYERLELLCSSSGASVGWAAAEPPAKLGPLGQSPSAAAPPLSARPWDPLRDLGSPWQVASYSSMVAGRTYDPDEAPSDQPLIPGDAQLKAEQAAEHDDRAPEGAAQDAGARVTEAADALLPGDGAATGAGAELPQPAPRAGQGLDSPIPWEGLWGGTDTGLWIHEVFELLDFGSGQGKDGSDLATLVAAAGERHGARDDTQHALVAAALPGLLATPLDGGPTALPPGFALRDLAPAHRLDELPFDLRLGAGNRWRHGGSESGRIDPEAARVALARRGGSPDWGGDAWLQALLERRRDGALAPVLPGITGILTGFVDLVFRVPLGEAAPPADGAAWRYFVADYKTNRIAPPSARRDSRLRHYTPPWLAWEMGRHGYHLQALLYTVALHRLLQQRLGTRYSPQRHLGGHLYLFLRGMGAGERPQGQSTSLGVYSDRWPAEVVLGIDAALSGASPKAVEALMDRAARQGGLR